MPEAITDATIRFPEKMRLRTPRGFSEAVRLAAMRHHTGPAEYARQAVLRALLQDGVRISGGRAQTVSQHDHA